jgi:mannose-6-phosphate isomerase-like protein (cupin superfamily)
VELRRIVTGHSPEGKAIVASDGPLVRVSRPEFRPGQAFGSIWATDYGMTAVPGSEDPTPRITTYVPPEGGTRLVQVIIPPDSDPVPPGVTAEQALAWRREHLPGLAEAMEPEGRGMHTTDSVDYDIIMSGELWLELDDGVQVHLKPGDIVIQTGTRHAWRNKGNVPCVMYSVLVGTPRR